MLGDDPGALLDPPEGTRESLDSLETRFRRAYGRDMTPEERKYFALVERVVRFEPDGKSEPQAIHEPKREDAPTAAAEQPDGPDSDSPKAA